MTLENIALVERKKLTRSYPVLIASRPNSGKSASVEFLSDEDKKRTIIFDVEGKGLPEDTPDIYRSVYKLKPKDIDPKSKGYKDEGNVKYLSITELIARMVAAIGHKDVDRIIIDSFTSFVNALEAHLVTVHNGFTIWSKYSIALNEFFAMIKEETYTHGKFVYIMAHYRPAKDKKDTESENFAQVKGTAHYRMVESNFNSVISIDNFQFIADNSDEFTSTRIKRSLNPLQTDDNNMDVLEHILTGTELPAE